MATSNRPYKSHVAAYGFDYSAYGCLIWHCTNHDLVRQAKQLHARLVLFSVTPINFLASKLITFYCKSNNLREARCVFDRIPDKNIFSWNALLLGFSLHGMHLEVLKLFSFLVFTNLRDEKSDCYTISCALRHYHRRFLIQGWQIRFIVLFFVVGWSQNFLSSML
ncbi:hypothetical protein CJ030_MR0G025554 [Morella rubra]|uniref:Pentatricopeptide repeat-containing protein n=1 Tax=Morella rubra TaxID=262757 RepID=A0A6A1UGH7_9ROSI|nr:hypothetical protein CJ030_MR0G025554 [Morella rubra]